jgi:hypothetical protein
MRRIRWKDQRQLRLPRLLLVILLLMLPVALGAGVWTSSVENELDPSDAREFESLPRPYLSDPDRKWELEPEPEWWEVFAV